MIEFLEAHGATIVAILTAAAGLFTAVYNMTKVFKINKKVDTNAESTKQDIQITRDGIIEAFKTAKIPTEWKISVSNQVNTILTQWRDEFIAILKESETTRDEIMTMILKILAFTAASNKLTDEEKAKIDELIKSISEKDSTIDITE